MLREHSLISQQLVLIHTSIFSVRVVSMVLDVEVSKTGKSHITKSKGAFNPSLTVTVRTDLKLLEVSNDLALFTAAPHCITKADSCFPALRITLGLEVASRLLFMFSSSSRHSTSLWLLIPTIYWSLRPPVPVRHREHFLSSLS